MSKNSTMYQRWMPKPWEVAEAKRKAGEAAARLDCIAAAIAIGTQEAYDALSVECKNEISFKTFARNVIVQRKQQAR
jgi:hypothetical protein